MMRRVLKGKLAFGLEQLGMQVVIELIQHLISRTSMSYWIPTNH